MAIGASFSLQRAKIVDCKLHYAEGEILKLIQIMKIVFGRRSTKGKGVQCGLKRYLLGSRAGLGRQELAHRRTLDGKTDMGAPR